MRHPLLAIFAIAIVLLSACGREYTGTSKMNQDEAFSMLTNVPMNATEGRGALFKRNRVSAEGLVQLLKQLIESGQIKLPSSTRGALTSSGSIDLSSLTNIFSLLQGGGLGGIAGLASGLVNSAGGTTKAKFDITTIMSILNAALPVIAMIAPQYAGIVQALVVILPMVMTFINLFKKPQPAPTAWNLRVVPTLLAA